MQEFLAIAEYTVKAGRFLVLLFNTRDSLSWEYLHIFLQESTDDHLEYRGYFPLPYSARSVVQDSREGSLKHDFALVFQKPGLSAEDTDRICRLQRLEGWSNALPQKK